MTRILIADDNAQNRYHLETLLRSQGFQVDSAADGKEALTRIQDSIPDLVLTDIFMPVMDGFELCRVLKADPRWRAVPFVFYTATCTDPKDEQFALSLGADRFVIKPQEPDRLFAMVREVLDQDRGLREHATDELLDSEMAFLCQHNETLYHKLDKKIRDLRASNHLIEDLFDHSPSLIYILDLEGRFLHLNRKVEQLFQRTREQLIGRTRELVLPPEIAESQRANDLAVLAAGAAVTFEELHQEADGEHTYLSVKFPLRDEQGRSYAICGFSTDITGKKRLEQDLQRLSELHAMLYQANRTIRSAQSEEALLAEACRLCVEQGRFDLAWIGRTPPPGLLLQPEFVVGPLAASAQELTVPLDPVDPKAHCPGAISLREDRICVCQDWGSDPSVAPWRTRGLAMGIRSSAALPIHCDGRAVAVLCLYSRQSGFFTADRLALLEEMAGDISYALESLAGTRHRKAAEAALAAREMEYRAAFDQGAIGMAQVAPDGCFLRVNLRFCELLGHAPGELVGREVRAFMHPDDRACAAEHFAPSPEGGHDRFHASARYLRKDNQVIWLDLSGGPVLDLDGRVLYLLCAFEDITQQKAFEQRILEEKLKLQTLVQTLPDLIWLKDLQGAYRFCNRRFEAFFGTPEAEILGKTDYDYVDKDLADLFREHDRLAMEANGPSMNEEWVTFASDGHRALLETIKTPMKDASGRTIGVLGIARDVTQNRSDQERLRKLSKAIEQSPVMVVITDRNGTIEYVNPRFTERTGFTSEEVMGANPRLWKSGILPQEVYTALWNTILAGRVWQGEFQNRRKDGELYWESASIAPIFDDSGAITHFVALNEDITTRKESEESSRRQIEELRRWQEATLGREMRILDLKREVNEILGELGRPPRYESAREGPGEAPDTPDRQDRLSP